MRELSCAECLEVCPDVALGIADAESRANVLTHVERCRSCRDELSSLSDVADLLCVLAPHVDPPRGFASRVVYALSPSSRPEPRARPARRSYVRPLVAAAVLLAAATGVGGWLAAGGGSGPSYTAEAAPLVAHHQSIGQVTLVPGDKPWMSVAVRLRAGTTVVRCEVENVRGAWWTIGTFVVHNGHGYWAAPLPHALSVQRAELVTSNGDILAAASFAQG
jgi:ferredoxin